MGLTATPYDHFAGGFSPDGNAIAFHQLRARRGIGVIRRKVDGSWGEPLVRLDRGARPEWSPDGAMLLVASASADAESIEIMPVDSGAPVVVYRGADGSGSRSGSSFVYNGSDRLDFVTRIGGGPWPLREVDLPSGRAETRVEFDQTIHAVWAGPFRIERHTLYSLTATRERDVWVMTVLRS